MEKVFRKQVNDRGCGLASLAIVLDDVHQASCPQTSEEDLITRQVGPQKISLESVQEQGMTLQELSQLAWHAGMPNVVWYADQFKDSASFKRALQRLLRLGRRIILNYHMTTAGQPPFGGHFSPLVGIDEEKGAYVVFDCWKETVEDVVFLDQEKVWEAVRHVDDTSGKCRGFASISPKATLNFCSPEDDKTLHGRVHFVPCQVAKASAPFKAKLIEFVNDIYRNKPFVRQDLEPEQVFKRLKDDQLEELLEQKRIGILAVANKPIESAQDVEDLIGVVEYEFENEPDTIFWGMLCIGNRWRKKSLGSMLMDWLEVDCIRQGVTTLKMCYFDFEKDLDPYGKNYANKGYVEFEQASAESLHPFCKPDFRNCFFYNARLDLS